MAIDDKSQDPNSSAREDRVSNSRSGFTDTDFVLVFKSSNGDYSTPRKIPRATALAIAQDYKTNLKTANEFGISKTVAKFIMAKAIRHGLLPSPAADEELPNIAEFGTDVGVAESSTQDFKELQPRYFPKLDPYLKPDFPPRVIDAIAFILSGVDPEQLDDPRVAKGSLNLQQLVQTSTARVSPGLLLHDDHWYVLVHLHHLERDAFKHAWEDAQSQATGQANTDVVKLMNKLEKFRIDSAAKCLEDPANKQLFTEVEYRSIELLSRLFRRTRRKIEVAHEQQVPETAKKGVLETFLWRKSIKNQNASAVQSEIRDIVLEYLTHTAKIGRILRSKVLRSNRPKPNESK